MPIKVQTKALLATLSILSPNIGGTATSFAEP